MSVRARDVKPERSESSLRNALRALALTIVTLTAAGCASTEAPPILALPVQPVPQPPKQPALRTLLQSQAQPDILAFYEARDFRPAWTDGKNDEQDIAAIRAALSKAYEHGLSNADYSAPQHAASASETETARFEIAFTETVLRYARHLRAGRFRPSDIHADANLTAQAFDAPRELNRAVESGSLASYLAELPPRHSDYRRLAAALARYRAIAEEGGWPIVPGGSEIRLDRNDARLAALVERLTFEDGALDALPKPTPVQIRDAVKRFQARNGLADDGRPGPETIAALNVPAPVRVEQITANMERWRWLPAEFERRYIAVNVPDQSVQFVRDGAVALKSKVIVGRKSSATPIVRTEIKTVVVNPPWNIPGDIAARDLLPHLKRNANYLATKNMVVMDGPPGDPHGRTINWRRIVPAEFPYAIRQLPGPETGLGDLMLDSPNDFDVYLHDTPNKRLYGASNREISNGCVRVQDIFPLASLVLTDDPKDGMGRIAQARRTRDTQRIALDIPVPLYFLYWTASANADGSVDFRPDRYGRDTALIAALANRGRPAAPPLTPPTPGEEPAPELDDVLAP